MFFRNSGKAVVDNGQEKVQFPPVPGAEAREEPPPSVVASIPENTTVGDIDRPVSPIRYLSEDENDVSAKPSGVESSSKRTDNGEKNNVSSTYIKPANFDFWVRAIDVNGLIYYYNTKSGESTWLAPCIVCYKNGERFCLKCAAPFCDKHFQKKHKYLDNPDEHLWSTQEQQTNKEELTDPTEQEYCIECQLKVANRLCLECWDPYCQRCFELVHHVGNLKTHPVITYARGHEGWYTVHKYGLPANGNENPISSSSSKMIQQSAAAVTNAFGADGSSFIASGTSQRIDTQQEASSSVKNASNKPGLLEYYVHGGTKEVTYEKPEELMTDLEKVLLHNWKRHQHAAEDYVQQVEQLQFELEKVKYERDNLLVQNAQMAQGIMPVAGNAKKNKNQGGGNTAGSSRSGADNTGNSKRPETPVLEKLIDVESDDYRQKLLHPNDRKRGEARANYMKNLLEQPLPK